MNLSTQVDVLFFVVNWISSEDLNLLFPPLVSNGTKTTKEKNVLRELRKREKMNAAFSKLEKIVVGGDNIGKWSKRTIPRLEILEEVSQLIEKKSSNASLPVPPMDTKRLPNVSKSSVDVQLSIQPPETFLLKHSVDSILGFPRQVNSDPQPIFLPPTNPFYFQCYYFYIAMLNKAVQNQMLNTMENKENEN